MGGASACKHARRGSRFCRARADKQQPGPERRARIVPASLAGLRGLVVDDYDANRGALCEQLRRGLCGRFGRERPAALAALHAALGGQPYDVVFLTSTCPDERRQTAPSSAPTLRWRTCASPCLRAA
jgi:hypothetical protein